MVIASNVPSLGSIAVDTNNVYFTHAAIATAVTKSGILVGSVNPGGTLNDIAVDTNGVYLADGAGAIWRVPTTFTSTSALFNGGSSWQPTRLSVVNNVIYFTDASRSAIEYVSTGGGGTTNSYVIPLNLQSSLTINDIAGDANGFFWAEINITSGRVMALNGNVWGNARQMEGNQQESSCVALDSSYFYWGNFSGGDIWRAPRSGGNGSGAQIVTGQGSINDLAVAATALYWSSGVPGKIGKSALDGTNVTTVSSSGTPASIAFDGNAVYWTDSQNNRVMKLRQ
jgi:hypothetical protein